MFAGNRKEGLHPTLRMVACNPKRSACNLKGGVQATLRVVRATPKQECTQPQEGQLKLAFFGFFARLVDTDAGRTTP